MSDIKNLKDACEALNDARHYQPESSHRVLAVILTICAALAVTALILL